MEMVTSASSRLSEQVRNGEPVKVSFYFNSRRVNKFVNSVSAKVLSGNDMPYLQSTVETVLREMIVNAVKANSKRVFFRKNNLDIENPEHYALGMENFKSYLTDEVSEMADELKASGLKVEVFLKKSDDGYYFVVRNNSILLPYEEERIRMRLEKARSYSDFSEIYMDITDDQEGEGLGIPLTILFLRNSGIGENSFVIRSRKGYTETILKIPARLKPFEVTSLIMEQITEDVENLPTFPEHILELQNLCREKDVSINEIANRITVDPSLAAAVLRLANSAGFVTIKRIDNLAEAIKIIGLKNLNSILVATAARSILDERFSDFKAVWDHCNKVALYAREIALRKGLRKESEKVFLAGMLHDLGKIVLLSANSEMEEKIEEVAKRRGMRTSTVLEEVSLGISHSSLGRMIAEKWNFPEYLIEAIAFHHSPAEAGGENRDIVNTVYLANAYCQIEEKKFDPFYIEDDVLRRFDISSQDKFFSLHDQLKESVDS